LNTQNQSAAWAIDFNPFSNSNWGTYLLCSHGWQRRDWGSQ